MYGLILNMGFDTTPEPYGVNRQLKHECNQLQAEGFSELTSPASKQQSRTCLAAVPQLHSA